MKMTKKQAGLDKDKDGMITGKDFKIMSKKKYGGKITYRMSGGKVAGAGYDDQSQFCQTADYEARKEKEKTK